VLIGGFLGICLLRAAAGVFIWLLGKFPRFEIAAYLLVLVIGLKLLADWGFNSDWTTWSPGFEKWRHHAAESYENWLSKNWIFKIPPHQPPPPNANGPPPPAHLLDFHNLRRPECITFWLSMLLAFLTGFIPPRKKPQATQS